MAVAALDTKDIPAWKRDQGVGGVKRGELQLQVDRADTEALSQPGGLRTAERSKQSSRDQQLSGEPVGGPLLGLGWHGQQPSVEQDVAEFMGPHETAVNFSARCPPSWARRSVGVESDDGTAECYAGDSWAEVEVYVLHSEQTGSSGQVGEQSTVLRPTESPRQVGDQRPQLTGRVTIEALRQGELRLLEVELGRRLWRAG